MLHDPKVGGKYAKEVFKGVWWISDLSLSPEQIKIIEGKRWTALPGGWHSAPQDWDKSDPLEESQ